jgi:MFS family permease
MLSKSFLRFEQHARRNVRGPLQAMQVATFSTEKEKDNKPKGFIDKLFGFDTNIASPTFTNRWAMVAPAFFTHMCIGSPFGWSVMADQLTREYGFVASSSADWTLMNAALPLSLVFAANGIAAGTMGRWQMKVGVRKAIAVAGCCFGGGLLVGSAGIYMHSLPLLYLGYGALAGFGAGLSYTPPIQTLINWFPDKKGLASGLVLGGFGGGAIVFAPLVMALARNFAKLPEYVGTTAEVVTKVVDGKLMAASAAGGELVEVIQCGTAELAKLPYDLAQGYYVVGSGSTGAAEALGVLGLGYFATMMLSAATIKSPHPTVAAQFAPAAAVVPTPAPSAKKEGATSPAAVSSPAYEVTFDDAMRAPQFYMLGVTFFCLSAGGLGLFSVAKPMMSEVFSAAVPALATSAFASKFVLMLSAGNLGGRLFWASMSDYIGRRATFATITCASVPIYMSLPYLADAVISTQAAMPLYIFCAGTTMAVINMGGNFSVMPAYEADLFGSKYIGPIHGRMMMFLSAAALSGPYLVLKLRVISETKAIMELMTHISPADFEAKFGSSMEQASQLIETKVLTINRLLAMCPPEVIDPTPHVYDTSMYALSGVMGVATLAHLMVKPLSQKQIEGFRTRNAKIIEGTGVHIKE